MQQSNSRPGATVLLAFSAVLGAALAATGIIDSAPPEDPRNPVASVNGEIIGREEFLGYLDLVARDKRNRMTNADRRRVLDRIIEERLLLERGLSIGLPSSDSKVRKAIIDAMIQSVISDSRAEVPSEHQLHQFYSENTQYFARPARIQVRRMIFRGDYSLSRAEAAHAALADGDWQTVNDTLADRDILNLPNSPLPLHKLRDYIGPHLSEKVMALDPGSYSQVLDDGEDHCILWLIALRPTQPQPLESIRGQVIGEFQRRAGDQALRSYLLQLRQAANIEVDQTFMHQLDRLDDRQ